jgi:hypothetical protein
MISESEYKKDFEGLMVWHDDLLLRLIPHSRYNCIGYYEELTSYSDLENKKELFNCNIIEVLTEISININSFKDLLNWTGYRLLDITYSPDYFHFFIQKVE